MRNTLDHLLSRVTVDNEAFCLFFYITINDKKSKYYTL